MAVKMTQSEATPDWQTHALVFVAGALVGGVITRLVDSVVNRHEDESGSDWSGHKKQKIGHILSKMWFHFERWDPPYYKNEDPYSDHFFDYLKPHFGNKIERSPSTEVGEPDLLVEDLVVFEVKQSLSKKTDHNRAIGQILDYTQVYYVVPILINTNARNIRLFLQRLEKAGLSELYVWTKSIDEIRLPHDRKAKKKARVKERKTPVPRTGRTLFGFRAARNMSAQDIAGIVGVSSATIYKYEREDILLPAFWRDKLRKYREMQ